MYSATAKRVRSAAWRVSLWGTLVFACGTLLIFMSLHRVVSRDVQRRTDTWLTGEAAVLSDVAERTPKNALYGRVVGEIAELASREVPNRSSVSTGQNNWVFFLQTKSDGSPALWVGEGDESQHWKAITSTNVTSSMPFDVQVPGQKVPFRVAAEAMPDGGHIYLGLSEQGELHVLHQMREHFLRLWALTVLLGFAIIFYTTRRMLGDVRRISEAASNIGESDLSRRVPVTGRGDEIAQLASTLNHMLERIERSVNQVHSITNSLAHDLRSPLTAIRARLEFALTHDIKDQEVESIELAINEIDHLTEILNQSLDVAEAQADALRMEPAPVDLHELVSGMIELYMPCMNEKGLRLEFYSSGNVDVVADAALLHRMVSNLLDNEMKHLPPSRTVKVALSEQENCAQLVVEDDGPGFSSDIEPDLFKPRVKGSDSRGYGLGLAFVEAVAGAHGGSAVAENRTNGGARLVIKLPLKAAHAPLETASAG